MEQIESTNPANSQDIIDRKAAWMERMFDKLFFALQLNPYATMLILSVGLNFWQYSINNEMNQLRIKDITMLNEKINVAIEKGVQTELTRIQYKNYKEGASKKADSSRLVIIP